MEQVTLTLKHYESLKQELQLAHNKNSNLEIDLWFEKQKNEELNDAVLNCGYYDIFDHYDSNQVFVKPLFFYEPKVVEVIESGLIDRDYAVRFIEEKYAQYLMKEFGLKEREDGDC